MNKKLLSKIWIPVAIGLSLILVSSVYAADDSPPAIPTPATTCTNGALILSGQGICESNDWKICGTALKGQTAISASYICNGDTSKWVQCTTNGTSVEGKTCQSGVWGQTVAATNGVCGTANTKTYTYNATGFGTDTFCQTGTASPSPTFPTTAGSTVAWICNSPNGGTASPTCSASVALAPVNGACGTAAATYGLTEDFPKKKTTTDTTGDWCTAGAAQNPPASLMPGATANWSCQGANSGTAIQCTASRAGIPNTGLCGTAVKSYTSTETFPTGTLCITGATSSNVPATISPGSTKTWSCTLSGTTNACAATRANTPVGGVCGGAAKNYSASASFPAGDLCSAGTASNTPSSVSSSHSATWTCNGLYTGANASCTATRTAASTSSQVYQCNDGIDNDGDKKIDYPADPGCTSTSDNSETDPTPGAITFKKVAVYPQGFNPKVAETKISYQLSATGFLTIDIINESGATVVELLKDEQVDSDKEYSLFWDGTDKKGGGGKILKPGKYFAKISVKPAASAAVSDTKTEEVNIIYVEDFEDTPAVTDTTATLASGNTDIISIHNNPPKHTQGTGPEMGIYLLAPVIGYFVSRSKKK